MERSMTSPRQLEKRMTKTASTDVRIFVTYDHEARAQYQRLADKSIARSVERPDGTVVDVAADGSVVGIETLL
jgi:hypothetical protein